jgi:hypothetical protein
VDATHAANTPLGELGARVRASLPWLLALAGALLIVALSTIVTDEGGMLMEASGDQPLTMGGIRTVGQSMAIAQPELSGVAMRIPTLGQGSQALSLTVRLRYAAGPPIDLVRQSVSLGAVAGGVLTVRWAPISPARNPLTATENLNLILDFPKLPPGTGPSFVVRENLQGRGGLTIDGTVIADRDLVVAPIFQRRWADTIWPISAMAAGKPGPLGWPPLYPLLAYLYLVALVSGLAALWQLKR